MSNPGNYTLRQIDPDTDLDIAIDARRERARIELLRVLQKLKGKKPRRVSIGHVARSFDAAYIDVLYSLLMELSSDGKLKFDPDRPAPNYVELV